MWLPSDVYKALTQALVAPTDDVNSLTVAVAVRKMFLGSAAGDLGPERF